MLSFTKWIAMCHISSENFVHINWIKDLKLRRWIFLLLLLQFTVASYW